MIETIAICGTAGFLFLRGIYHSGVLSGWIAEGLSGKGRYACGEVWGGQHVDCRCRIKRTLADHLRAGREARAAAKVTDEARWRDLYLASPTAFWLDPNLWGDNPNWRDDLPIATPIPVVYGKTRIVPVMPRCPNCETAAAVIVLNTAGDEVTMWHCGHYMAEFTKKGETRKSKRARADREPKYPPPTREPHYLTYPKLPCGHTGAIRREPRSPGGFVASVCDQCEAEWWPRSDDSTGRSLAAGDRVHYRDVPLDMPPPPAVD